MRKNILVLGHKQHGKGTFCEFLKRYHDLSSISSSTYAMDTFLFSKLAPRYGYKTKQECFEDRHFHRDEWFTEIKDYNTPDASRMAREMLDLYPVYDGMRNDIEFEACLIADLFDIIFWIDASARKPLESKTSMKIDEDEDEDLMITVNNNGTLDDLQAYVKALDFTDPTLYKLR